MNYNNMSGLSPQIQGLRQGSVNLNSYAPPAQSKKKKQSALKTLLQIGVPIAGGAAGAFVGGPAGMLAGGAGASALLNYLGGGVEGETPIEAAKKDAIYSLLGFGVGKVAGPIVGKIGGKMLGKSVGEAAEQGGKLGKVGTNIKNSIAPAKLTVKSGYADDLAHSTNIAESLGFSGSAANRVKQDPAVSKTLQALVGDTVKKQNAAIPVKKLLSNFDDELSQLSIVKTPALNKATAAYKKTLMDLADNGATDTASAYKLKSLFTKQIGPIEKQLSAGISPLIPEQQTKLAAFRALKRTIDEVAPKAKPGAMGDISVLNEMQGQLNGIVQGAEKAATNKSALPMVGTALSPLKAGSQNLKAQLGGAMESLGAAGQTPLGRASGTIGGVLGAGFGNMGSDQPQQPSPEDQTMGQNPRDVQMTPQQDAQGNKWLEDAATGEILSEDSQWRFNPQTKQWEPNSTAQSGADGMEGLQQQLIALALQDLQNGGKNLAEIAAFMKIAGIEPGGKSGKLGVTAAQRIAFADSGQRGLKAAAEIFQEDPGILTKQLIPGKFGSRKFDSTLFRAVENLLRAKSGAAVPEQEVQRYMTKFGPTFGDSEEIAMYKLEQMFLDLEDIRNSSGQIDPSSDTNLLDLQNQAPSP